MPLTECLILLLYITDTLSSNLILLSDFTQFVLLKVIYINKDDLTLIVFCLISGYDFDGVGQIDPN